MKVVCISASNMKSAGENGTSVRVCRIIGKIITKDVKNAQIEIIRLVDVELSPCTGCGDCFKTSRCCNDNNFNNMYAKIVQSDALFIVSPHYAPIPAKLSMLLEKMEQIAFLPWFHDHSYESKVYKKPVGLIAHGGGSNKQTLRSYKGMVLDTISNALQTIMMDVVSLNEEWPNGVVFPIKEVHREDAGVFPIQIYDWTDVESRMTPLVKRVMEKVEDRS
jgi:multimeric flavodoxin WrbA